LSAISESDIAQRKTIARRLLDANTEPIDLELVVDPLTLPLDANLTADLGINFPAGLAPTPQPIEPPPATDAPLPKADVVIVTWTVAELDALADVFTPEWPRARWYRYNRHFEDRYRAQIRDGAPALKAQRLGSWFPTKVGDTSVICFKSELHLNQDGKPTGDGTATLPVKDLFAQIIEEVQPKLILTVGTSGGVAHDHDLGDVVVTRAAKFRCSSEFKNEPFNNQTYRSEWQIPDQFYPKAQELMQAYAPRLAEPEFGPPTKRYGDGPLQRSDPPNRPSILREGEELPEFHPILTTDFFEFGTSANNLFAEGCAVEMGDAVLGLLCDELPDPPRWAIVRNLSDPMINGDLPTEPRNLNMQTHWAVWYYEVYGYWTSVTGALATWAIVAGHGADA
jgi:nucleoside phosphorylase